MELLAGTKGFPCGQEYPVFAMGIYLRSTNTTNSLPEMFLLSAGFRAACGRAAIYCCRIEIVRNEG